MSPSKGQLRLEGKAEMVWTCAGAVDILDNGDGDGAVKQEEKRETTRKTHGWNEGRHAEGWCVSGGCWDRVRWTII